MTFLKRFALTLLCITASMLTALLLTSCTDNYEGGVLYDGLTVTDVDEDAESVTVKDGTTAIAAGAFKDCKRLTSVNLPDSISEIAPGAFDGCDALIKSEDGVLYVDNWAIGASEGTTEITIKDGTRGIAREAFINMSSLKSVSVPSSVKHIGARAFFRCSSLEKITLPFIGKSSTTKNSTHLGYIFGAFNKEQNSDYVPESLKEVHITNADEISDYAFSNCEKIVTVTLPKSVKSIGAQAFSECTALSSIDIPDSVSSIGDKAFYKCSALTSVRLPENADFTLIPEYTFAYCSSIRELTIPKSVKEIGACAIARCINLESIKFENELTERIGQQAFDGCKYLTSINLGAKKIEKAAFQNCIGLADVTLSEGSVEIEGYAFNGCSGITSFNMPKSVTKIGEFAFYACHSLTSITLGEGITKIEASTFQNCINLKGTVIPKSVMSVGENAFFGCNALITRRDGISFVDGWITEIQPSVTALEIGDEVVGFADGVFDDAANLSEITFTGAVESWEIIKKTVPASVISSVKIAISSNKS